MIKLDSSNSDYFSRRGYCNNRLGLYEEAINDYTQAITNSPERYFYYDNRAEVYYFMSNWDAAYNDLTLSIVKNPRRSGKTLNNRGLALIKLGKITEACKDFKESSNLGDKNGKQNYELYCQ